MEEEILELKRSNKKLKAAIVILIFCIVLMIFLLIIFACLGKGNKNSEENKEDNKVIEENNKNQLINDAFKFISLASQEVVRDRDFRDNINEEYKIYYLNNPIFDNQLLLDPVGESYNRDTSYVKYTKNSGYCIYLEGSKQVVKNDLDSDACAPQENLYYNVVFNK
jgi:hypothetical protein